MRGVFEKIQDSGRVVEDISYERLVDYKNLMYAWKKFSRGKWRQQEVQQFWFMLEQSLESLYHDLSHGAYQHGQYYHFVHHGVKKRDIFVAPVRDRIVHQLLSLYMERIFEPRIHEHSYAARKNKGVAKARMYIIRHIRRSRRLSRKIWIAKLDVQKYFSNIEHSILLDLLNRGIKDQKISELFSIVIKSFGAGRGIPLGNHTSQWFANIYLNEMDFYAKKILHIPVYMRYNDDIIIASAMESQIRYWAGQLVDFAGKRLHLLIPSYKIEIACLPRNSIDILGLCTNGSRQWIRPATEKKARQALIQSYHDQNPQLLDAMCAYYSSGITYALHNNDILS